MPHSPICAASSDRVLIPKNAMTFLQLLVHIPGHDLAQPAIVNDLSDVRPAVAPMASCETRPNARIADQYLQPCQGEPPQARLRYWSALLHVSTESNSVVRSTVNWPAVRASEVTTPVAAVGV